MKPVGVAPDKPLVNTTRTHAHTHTHTEQSYSKWYNFCFRKLCNPVPKRAVLKSSFNTGDTTCRSNRFPFVSLCWFHKPVLFKNPGQKPKTVQHCNVTSFKDEDEIRCIHPQTGKATTSAGMVA